MKNFITIAVLGIGLCFSNITLAGAGAPGHTHAHDIDANGAKQAGEKVLTTLVQRKKIDQSWNGAKPISAEKKQFKSATEWVVTFNNAQVSDKSKQNLYIFLSTSGKYIAANFTGQ